MTYTCVHCTLDNAPADHFYWSNGKKGPCKTTHKARVAKKWREDPDHRARHNSNKYKARYGIAIDEYDQMVADQNGQCYICNTTPDHKLRVDHCHAKGAVRRLLCHGCNTALGLVKEDTQTLQNMINYLNDHT